MSKTKQTSLLFPLLSRWCVKVKSCTTHQVYCETDINNVTLIVPRQRNTPVFVGSHINVTVCGYQGGGVVTASEV